MTIKKKEYLEILNKLNKLSNKKALAFARAVCLEGNDD